MEGCVLAVRVLRLAPYVSIPSVPQFSRNLTGFGRSVWDISRFSAKDGLEVFLLTYACTSHLTLEGVTFVLHRPSDSLTSAHVGDVPEAVRAVLGGLGRGLSMRLKSARHILLQGYVERVIQQLDPDIIHIHGLSLPFLAASLRTNCPIVVTLHGLNSLEPSIRISAAERNLEGPLIEAINRVGIHVSVTSSGVRANILREFHIDAPDRIHVITDGVDSERFRTGLQKEELRHKYGIPTDAKVILNVSSLIPLKNQASILAALGHLSPMDNILCVLVGDGPEQARLEGFAKEHRLKAFLRMVGHQEGQALVDFYRLADVFVLASTTEGFGRPLPEAMAAGLPIVTFGDLEAVQDLYHPECFQLASTRDPHDLADAIKKALVRNWNREVIQTHALTFSWDHIVQQYMELYDVVISSFPGCRKAEFAQLLARQVATRQTGAISRLSWCRINERGVRCHALMADAVALRSRC